MSFEDLDDLSITNIKKVYMKHFGMLEVRSCDVLAGEQGLSCSSVKQLPNLKVIHVRKVEGALVELVVSGGRERLTTFPWVMLLSMTRLRLLWHH